MTTQTYRRGDPVKLTDALHALVREENYHFPAGTGGVVRTDTGDAHVCVVLAGCPQAVSVPRDRLEPRTPGG